jgi:hypothetical protein
VNCFPDDVLAAFRAKKAGRPQTWIARCPLHEDRCPSLSLWLVDGGRKLCLGCWSCRARAGGGHGYKRDILAWAGLRMGDLFADRHRENGGAQPHVQPKAVAVYPYTDEHGEVLYEKVRYEPGRRPGEKKEFKQRRPDGCGGHVWGLGSVRRVPYRLPDLVRCPSLPVLLLAGEKDVETFYSLGLAGALATCTTEGEGSGWGLDSPYPDYFRGRRVVVIPDEDSTGLTHARNVVGALVMAGVAAVRLVRLPGLEYRDRGGPDLSDWVALYRTVHLARAALVETVLGVEEYRQGGGAYRGIHPQKGGDE